MAEDDDDPDMDALTIQLGELHVADMLRRQQKMTMPDPSLVAEMEGAACKKYYRIYQVAYLRW
jgi:hypothetical protein